MRRGCSQITPPGTMSWHVSDFRREGLKEQPGAPSSSIYGACKCYPDDAQVGGCLCLDSIHVDPRNCGSLCAQIPWVNAPLAVAEYPGLKSCSAHRIARSDRYQSAGSCLTSLGPRSQITCKDPWTQRSASLVCYNRHAVDLCVVSKLVHAFARSFQAPDAPKMDSLAQPLQSRGAGAKRGWPYSRSRNTALHEAFAYV